MNKPTDTNGDGTENRHTELLNAGRSPKSVKPIGVRRLNYVPLYLVGGGLLVVVLLVMWTALERAKAVAPKEPDHGGSTMDYATSIAGDKTGYIPPALLHPTATPAEPAAKSESAPVATPTPDEEAEARKKAFYEALFAQSSVKDPTVQQVQNTHLQQVSATDATRLAKADPNNLGGLTPEQLAGYTRQVTGMGAGGAAPPDPNNINTYNGDKDRWKLNTHLEAPTTPYILRTGSIIPALLLTAMESELPGTITAQVSQDVYDTPKGEFLLIPQGSRLVGEYSNLVQYGQARIFVAWQRIIYPDGSALDIGAMPGTDQEGKAGFSDQVNNHYVRLFSSALLMSAITAGITISQPNQSNYSNHVSASDALSEALGQQLGAATSALLEKNLSIAPTLNIRPAYRFNIMVVKDLTFQRPYTVGNY